MQNLLLRLIRAEAPAARTGVGVIAALAAAAGVAYGQGSSELVGTVRDDEGRGVPHAQVVLVTSGRGALTGGDGRFRLGPLPAGRHVFEVALLGYGPARGEVELRPGERREIEVVLERTPLSLPGVQVTATVGARDPLAVTQATTQLAGAALEREMGGTIAQTLRMQPGLAVRSMGPAATAPVMRGLTGDRVLVLQDGQRTGDLAGSADDHGITIDPLTAQRVEVVRGPATLLYGNNALGGVVNVISGDLPSGSASGAAWSLSAQTESAYPGGALSGRGVVPLPGGWLLGLRGGGRSTGDMRIPDEPVLGDRLRNTGHRNWSASAGVSRAGERAMGGAALRLYRFEYGLPTPPDAEPVSLEGGRQELLGRLELTPAAGFWRSARLDGTVQDYLHRELEPGSGELLQTFALKTRSVNLLASHAGLLGSEAAAEGAWGLSALRKEYTATGPAALTPPADSRAIGAFGYQEVGLPFGGAALQLGARFDRYEIAALETPKSCTPERCDVEEGGGVSRVFESISGSVGARIPLAAHVSLGASVARSFRAPTVEELFSGAAHAGTGAVELGNARLRAERGTGAEVVLRARHARLTAQLAAFRNEIGGYVHLVARGDSLVGGVLLPVLEYDQTRALLRGVEGSVDWAATRNVALGVMGDYLHAAERGGRPLSFMPPPRIGASARWDDGRLSAGADVHHELRQDRVGAADEAATPAHTIVRLTAGLRWTAGDQVHSVSLRAENLTNELHREATSRIKDFAPGPGRNLAVLYRVVF